MSLEVLQQKLSALDANSQRQLTAFLVSLQDVREAGYLHLLAQRINKPVSEFATLEVLDRRLNLPENGGNQ